MCWDDWVSPTWVDARVNITWLELISLFRLHLFDPSIFLWRRLCCSFELFRTPSFACGWTYWPWSWSLCHVRDAQHPDFREPVESLTRYNAFKWDRSDIFQAEPENLIKSPTRSTQTALGINWFFYTIMSSWYLGSQFMLLKSSQPKPCSYRKMLNFARRCQARWGADQGAWLFMNLVERSTSGEGSMIQ